MERFASFDGVEIAYQIVGSGPPVLMLHGFASSFYGNFVVNGVSGAIVASGRQVIAPDARGHGRSEKPHDPSAYDDDAMVHDAIALLDELGIDSVDVVGYSMGAMASARVVARDPRPRSVVLGGIGGDGVPPRPAGRLATALLAEEPDAISHPVAKGFRQFADLTKADRVALAAVDKSDSMRSPIAFDRITVPALVLVGDKDQLIGSASELADRLPASRLVVLPGDHLSVVGHEGFARTIVRFLAEVSPVG